MSHHATTVKRLFRIENFLLRSSSADLVRSGISMTAFQNFTILLAFPVMQSAMKTQSLLRNLLSSNKTNEYFIACKSFCVKLWWPYHGTYHGTIDTRNMNTKLLIYFLSKLSLVITETLVNIREYYHYRFNSCVFFLRSNFGKFTRWLNLLSLWNRLRLHPIPSRSQKGSRCRLKL